MAGQVVWARSLFARCRLTMQKVVELQPNLTTQPLGLQVRKQVALPQCYAFRKKDSTPRKGRECQQSGEEPFMAYVLKSSTWPELPRNDVQNRTLQVSGRRVAPPCQCRRPEAFPLCRLILSTGSLQGCCSALRTFWWPAGGSRQRQSSAEI